MVEAAMVRIMRHRRTKGAETDRPNLKPHIPSLYSTHGVPQSEVSIAAGYGRDYQENWG